KIAEQSEAYFEMTKIYFIFGVHNHQPIGNFPEVFEQAYDLAYKPFIELMSKHPKIKFNLHCSGILWEYLNDKHKEYLTIVKEMIDRNQVELLTGGYYEPIIPVLPDRDKIGQIKKLTSYLKSKFNFKSRGMWLAERVWETHLPKILSTAAVEYTVLDDYHFISSGIPEEELTGYYITEEQGYTLKIFPINQKLRYYMPWKTVEDTMKYLQSRRTDREVICLTMADDGEKYGLWPQTHKLVYEEKWLDKFLTALEENSDWITTLTFSEALKFLPDKGRVYLPQASYFEMTEWALPTSAQEEIQDVVKEIDNLPTKEKISKFIRGSHWRNFLVKYHESNNMYKKMLYVSNKIEKARKQKNTKARRETKEALDFLYAGQCNCAYWHGVFGGLYLPHLRTAIYKNLIEAEVLIDKIQKKEEDTSGEDVKVSVFDFDSDGKKEIIFETPSQNLYFQPHCGATLFEWDLKHKVGGGINLQNVLTRRKEAYHRKLKEMIESKRNTALGERAIGEAGEGAAKSIKTVAEIVGVKEENLDAYLHYDWYKRYSLIDHFIHPETKYDDFKRCKYGEQGDFVLGEYNFKEENGRGVKFLREGIVWVKDKPVRIKLEKIILIKSNALKVSYHITNLSETKSVLFFAPELNLSFSSQKPEDNIRGDKKETASWIRIDEQQNLKVKIDFSAPLPNLWTFPIETVSLSEAGFERTYQGTSVTAVWEVLLEHNITQEYTITITVISL
ncbi:MAG: DUF1926 domain-containing protein, partial [Elusimicrobiota bacterium]|nr:DUF1926 domain-containing protein [Elusimicrobiota bacterium]